MASTNTRQERSKANSLSPAQKEFISFLKKQKRKLKDSEIPEVLHGMKRFVKVVQKIKTEPQAQVYIGEHTKNKKVTKKTIITTSIEEFAKLANGKSTPIEKAFRQLHKMYEPKRT